jgi:hypothetical protein
LGNFFYINYYFRCQDDKTKRFLDKQDVFYKFIEHYTDENTLNSCYLNIENVLERTLLKKKDPIQIVYSIYNCVKQICLELVLNSKNITGKINYKKLINSDLYQNIKENVYYLQKFEILSLKEENIKKSFLINLFNLMFVFNFLKYRYIR